MDFLTQEQQVEINMLKANYQSALADFLAKHDVVQGLNEKLTAIDKTIAAAEGEAEATRTERKSLITSILGGDTKPLKAAKAKERSAYALLEDYQELRADLIKEKQLLVFETMTARDNAAEQRNLAKNRIAEILRDHAIQVLCQSQAMGLLVSAMRIQLPDYQELPPAAIARLLQTNAEKDWFSGGIHSKDLESTLFEIRKAMPDIAPKIPDSITDLAAAVPSCNEYEWLSATARHRAMVELGLK
ncbi:hypothetical protein [Chitinibacter tainanensis]|uniref:hypothetical protein n=1 Tax=Chitinibacter tainanensis TaxID=230667 RepID=UPI002351FBC5|nr:hypothetical protein [Chitinibacter tainanensis]